MFTIIVVFSETYEARTCRQASQNENSSTDEPKVLKLQNVCQR